MANGMPPSDQRAEVLRALPDIPRWVEGRAIVLAGCGSVLRAPGGWIIRNDRPEGRLAVVVGRPPREVIAAALSDRSGREVLCATEDEEATAVLLPGWKRERALLYRLATLDALSPEDDRVRILGLADTLDHLPEKLRDELDRARRRQAIHTAFVEGLPVSFAYAYWTTEGQSDLSIDTAPPYRRRGLARLACSALIRDQLDRGRRPVWGAMASNIASQQLAARLGFEKVDEVVLFTES
jgi:GNAT superfamily N-acetyltransferase